MSNATEPLTGQGNVMPAELGLKFVRWGLVQFLVGLIVGFVPLLHYFHGAVAGDVGPVFLKNMTRVEESCHVIPRPELYLEFLSF